MSDERWYVAVDGHQLEGDYDGAQVRQMIVRYANRSMVVWTESMSDWVDPRTLPAFRSPGGAPAAAPSGPPPAPSAAAAAARHTAAADQAALPDVRETFQQDIGFFSGLLDVKFNAYLTPKVIRALYILSMVAVALGLVFMELTALGMIFTGGYAGGFGGRVFGLAWAVLAPVLAVIQLTVIRMLLEVVLVLFSIKESTAAMAAQRG